MIAADTNVWARAYLNDDPEQAASARQAIGDGCSMGGVFVPLVVLAELYWVLSRRWAKERVLDTLEHLLATDGVEVESPSLVAVAIAEARRGATGLADLIIAEVAFAHGAEKIVTFDKAFGRRTRVQRLN